MSKSVQSIPEHLFADLVELGQTWITEAQDAHGFLFTKTRNAVGISDPEARARIQGNLNHAVGLLCAAHVMGLFEKKFPSEYWDGILEPSEVQTLKAYRHIRRCAANGFTGDRVVEDSAEFDAVMASENPFQGVESYDEQTIRLTERIGYEVIPFLKDMTNKGLMATHK